MHLPILQQRPKYSQLGLRLSLLLFLISPLFSNPARAESNYNLSCTIMLKTDQELETYKDCISNSEGKIKLNSKYLKTLLFEDKQVAPMYFGAGCYWISHEGKIQKTQCYDNAPDDFIDGIARYIDENHKFGFMNEKLEPVIAARFDFVFPFGEGKAQYCNGCKTLLVGEHAVPFGGSWGSIDRDGKVLEEDKKIADKDDDLKSLLAKESFVITRIEFPAKKESKTTSDQFPFSQRFVFFKDNKEVASYMDCDTIAPVHRIEVYFSKDRKKIDEVKELGPGWQPLRTLSGQAAQAFEEIHWIPIVQKTK